MEHQDKRLEIPLTALRAGETGIIISIGSNPERRRWNRDHGRGSGHGFIKRLMDMGLTPGTEVTVIRAAPFHGPVEILVRGSRLALGRGMAQRILVEKTKRKPGS